MPLQLSQPALVVVDMQEHFRSCALDIVPRVNEAIALARQLDLPIFYSQHGHPNPAEDHDHNVLVAYLGPDNSIKTGSTAYQLLPELDLDPVKDTKISKQVYDAFLGKPSLEQLLKDNGRNGIIVTGVCTNLCCETTARSAVCRGFPIIFLQDANATYTEDMQEATLLNIECGFGEVLTLSEVKKRIDEKGLERAFPVGQQ